MPTIMSIFFIPMPKFRHWCQLIDIVGYNEYALYHENVEKYGLKKQLFGAHGFTQTQSLTIDILKTVTIFFNFQINTYCRPEVLPVC